MPSIKNLFNSDKPPTTPTATPKPTKKNMVQKGPVQQLLKVKKKLHTPLH